MKTLFALPFETYESSKTETGVIYNLVDHEMTAVLQIWVTHRPYADHDLCIKEMTQCPSNVRNAAIAILDVLFDKKWRVLTKFTASQVRQSTRLQALQYGERCVSLSYSKDARKLIQGPPKMR